VNVCRLDRDESDGVYGKWKERKGIRFICPYICVRVAAILGFTMNDEARVDEKILTSCLIRSTFYDR
jgi:hypothetical protein